MIKQWWEWIIFWFGCFILFFEVEDHPECSLSSFDVQPSLEHSYHSWVCVLLMAFSQNAYFNILKVSENVFPNLKQNFTQTRCSWKSPILNCWKICPASKTCLHSNRHSTVTEQTRTVRFVAFTWGNSLLCCATSGTSLHLCVGVLIQKFGNLMDGPHICVVQWCLIITS